MNQKDTHITWEIPRVFEVLFQDKDQTDALLHSYLSLLLISPVASMLLNGTIANPSSSLIFQ